MNITARIRKITFAGSPTQYVVETASGTDWCPIEESTKQLGYAHSMLQSLATYEMRQVYVTKNENATVLAVVI